MTQTSLTPVVYIDSTELSPEWLDALIELRVERQYQVPSRVSLRFTDPGYKLVSSTKAALGTKVEVKGPVAPHTTMISAEVVSISSEQVPGDQPELVMVALDKSHRLGRTTRVKVFNKVTYSEIVATLANDAGLTPAVHSTTGTVEYLMQAESDMALITEAARRTGYDWWVEGETLHFAAPEAAEVVTVTLGADLMSFSARATGLKPSEVVVDGWDRSGQQLVSANKSSASAPVPNSDFAALADKVAFGTTTVKVSGLAPQEASEADHLAQSVMDRAATASVTAKGTAQGNPAIALGKKIKVEQAGPLSGEYPVTAVEHLYRPSRGFVTRFTSGERRPTTLVDTLSGVALPGAGAGTGAYAGPAHARSGMTVGKVTSNNDPDKRGRVKLRFPGMADDAETTWARVVSVGGGAKRGGVWIPEVDDEVLVGFEGGDARQPVVIGGLFGEVSTMPTTEVAEGKVQARGMTSRLGHSVLLLDGAAPGKQAIEMALSGQTTKVIHLGEDKLSMKVPSGTPVEIQTDDASFKISSSGEITMKAVNITIQAEAALKLQGAQVSVQGDATVDLKAQAKMGISAAILEMQSEGPAKLAGTPVMIN